MLKDFRFVFKRKYKNKTNIVSLSFFNDPFQNVNNVLHVKFKNIKKKVLTKRKKKFEILFLNS
jgi:hypothetical protein